MPSSEKPREACGIFGIFGQEEAAKLTYFGLYALQHRGQESAGIASFKDGSVIPYKGMGLVSDVFDMPKLQQLEGMSAIGHVRYSTTGSSNLSNAQPFAVRHKKKSYAVAHNGNLVNAHLLKNELEKLFNIVLAEGVDCGYSMRDVITGILSSKPLPFGLGFLTTVGAYIEVVLERSFKMATDPDKAKAEYRQAVENYIALTKDKALFDTEL